MKVYVILIGSKYVNDFYDGISMKVEEEFFYIFCDFLDGKYINNNFVILLSIFILNF